MTVYYISCSQYTTNIDGTTKDVGVYVKSLIYSHVTNIKDAINDFMEAHAQSEFAKDGWKLVGAPAYIVLKPKFFANYSECIDDGVVEDKKKKPANNVSHLRLVKFTL